MLVVVDNISDRVSGQFLELVGEPRDTFISNDYPIRVELSGETAYVFYTKVREVKARDFFALMDGGK